MRFDSLIVVVSYVREGAEKRRSQALSYMLIV